MTAVKVVMLRCDGCGERETPGRGDYVLHNDRRRPAELRREAAEQGWTWKLGADLCPDCADTRQEARP